MAKTFKVEKKTDLNNIVTYDIYEIVDMVDDKDKPVKVKVKVRTTPESMLQNEIDSMQVQLDEKKFLMAEIIKIK
ncbi:MAG: hypothetical protein ACSLE0_23410 [Chitinophagaceae bacterium]